MAASSQEPETTVTKAVPFAALRHRNFRGYFVGGMLSMMADTIEHVISYWVIFQLFQSPALAGFAVISHWMPHLLFSWYFGGVADRYDCRKIIQAAQALFIAVSWTWALLIFTNSLQMWHAMVLLVGHGFAGTLWSPARVLLIYQIVGREHLQSAVRLNATGRQVGTLAGPALGGGLMLAFGPSLGLLLNGLIYLPLTVWLLMVPYTGHSADAPKPRQLSWKDMFGAMREVQGSRIILSMIMLTGLSSLLVGTAFQAQMPEFARDLGTDKMGFGYSALLAASGAGAVIGGLLLESGGFLQARGRTAILLGMIWCLAMGLFAGITYYPVALVLLVVAGICYLAFASMTQTIVQLLAPPELRGRLMGLFIMSSQGLRTFSGVSVGLLGSYIGIHWSLGLSTGLLFLLMLGLLAMTPRSD